MPSQAYKIAQYPVEGINVENVEKQVFSQRHYVLSDEGFYVLANVGSVSSTADGNLNNNGYLASSILEFDVSAADNKYENIRCGIGFAGAEINFTMMQHTYNNRIVDKIRVIHASQVAGGAFLLLNFLFPATVDVYVINNKQRDWNLLLNPYTMPMIPSNFNYKDFNLEAYTLIKSQDIDLKIVIPLSTQIIKNAYIKIANITRP